jgi:hypothetical protein
MLITGLVETLRAAPGETPLAARSVIGVCVLALALGVQVPKHFAVWLCNLAWRGGLREKSQEVNPAPHAAERPLYWLVLSILALCGGVLAAVAPWTARGVIAVRLWFLENFLWSAVPREVLDTATALLLVLLPLGVLGIVISCVHHLCCRQAEWEESATAWCLMGAAGGMAAAIAIADVISPAGALIASALPLLVIAILAAPLGSSDEPSLGEAELGATAMPTASDRWPRLLRAAIVAVGGGAACAAHVWSEQLSVAPVDGAIQVAAVVLATALGMFAGHRYGFGRAHSIGAFGATCSIAGLGAALGSLALREGQSAGLFAVGLACVGAGGIGYALSFGQQTLLDRVAQRSAAGAQELGWMLGCAALTVIATAPLAVGVFGPRAAMLMLALSLVALGGLLAIHETFHATGRGPVRMATVFASLAITLALALATPSAPPHGLSAAAASIGR